MPLLKDAFRRHRPAEEGMALIMTLWVLTALAAMVVPLAVGARQDGLRSLRAIEDVTLRAAIDAAFARALAEIAAGEAGLGREREWRFGEVELRYLVGGESGRVDLNAASPETLEALFAAHGFAGAEAAALRDRLLDWRDRDDLRRLRGAERADYEAAAATEMPGDGPLRHPGELRRVLAGAGIAEAGPGSRLEEDVTVWTGATAPVPRLASPRLRARLGGLGATVPEGEEDPSITGRDLDPGGVYRIDIRARLPNGAARRTMAVVAQREGGWRTLEWMTPLVLEERDE